MAPIHRRQWLAAAPLAAGAGLAALHPDRAAHAAPPEPAGPFGYSLNTSTIREQVKPIADKVDIAAKAGYDGIEPWIRELDEHVQGGGTLADLRKRIEDRGLKVVNAIGFFDWAVDDDVRRKKGFDEARRNMEQVRALGGGRIAAPPAGAVDRDDLDPRRLADRYRELLELGRELGVTPMVEVWGFSKTLGNLAQAVEVAIGADHPDACVLADVYHLHRGGSGFRGLGLLGPRSMHVLHMNDYPAEPPREKLNDSDRVYPGDGSAPLGEIIRTLRDIGFHGMLSLELFNKHYYQQDPLEVARTGLAKMKAAVEAALA